MPPSITRAHPAAPLSLPRGSSQGCDEPPVDSTAEIRQAISQRPAKAKGFGVLPDLGAVPQEGADHIDMLCRGCLRESSLASVTSTRHTCQTAL